MKEDKAVLTTDSENTALECGGNWTISFLDDVPQAMAQLQFSKGHAISIVGKQLVSLDSAGALAIKQFSSTLQSKGHEVIFNQFSKKHHDMLTLIDTNEQAINFKQPLVTKDDFLVAIGKETINKVNQVDGFIVLLGDLSTKLFQAFYSLKRFHFPSIVSIIESAGLKALPIVALLSFLIGVVLAYQMGLQLKTYGANIFIAMLSGLAVFREFGPLITAIIVAGRTSSAFTAELGSMKINEEIDALLTMGLSPTELLILPRVIGLLLIFPLLIFWADIFGILGAMMMSKTLLHVGYSDFLVEIKDVVGLKQFLLGIYKAPAYALVISLVGCYQGFMVKSNSDSIGSQTTKSVVQALFLIIIVDAAYSIIYSWLGL